MLITSALGEVEQCYQALCLDQKFASIADTSAVMVWQDSFECFCLPASTLPCPQTLSANSDGVSHLATQSSSPLTDSPP